MVGIRRSQCWQPSTFEVLHKHLLLDSGTLSTLCPPLNVRLGSRWIDSLYLSFLPFPLTPGLQNLTVSITAGDISMLFPWLKINSF